MRAEQIRVELVSVRGRLHRRDLTSRRCRGLRVLVVAACAASLAACGSATATGVAHLGSTTTTTAPATVAGNTGASTAALLSFAACMRSHGEPNYPDPGAEPSAIAKLAPFSLRFRAAEKACAHYLPQGAPASPVERARVEQQALTFAKCMQTHGMPSWPDPTSQGYMVAPAGAAASSPAYLHAKKACGALLPTG